MERLKHAVDSRFLINVPVPAQTRTYKPVPHKQLMDLTLEGMAKAGYQLKAEEYLSNEAGKEASAYYDFNFGGDPEMGMRIAWQNSYNKKINMKFAIGGHVFVCSNGALVGDLGTFQHKHLGNIQTLTPEKINTFIDMAPSVYDKVVGDKNRMKEIGIDRKVIAEIIGDLYINEELIRSEQLSVIKDELEHPTFDYKAEGTAWQLYSHITHSLKRAPANRYIGDHQKLHDYFTQRFNLNSKTEATSIYVSFPQ
jgi:hypothetical protein